MLLKPHEKLLFIGDSVTDVGRQQPVGSGYGFGLGYGYPMLVNARLGLERPDEDFELLNLGTSGHTTRDLLGRWDRDVIAHQPHVVSILIGINDVWRQYDNPGRSEQITVEEYEVNLRSMLDQTLPHVRAILLLTPFFLELHRDDPMRATTDAYAAVCRNLAKDDERIFLVDTQKAFDELLMNRHYMTIAADRVHPNTIGHLLMADMVADTILNEAIES